MTKELAALLERLPEIKADDFSDLPKYKRWWLSQTDEYFARRNARRRQLRKKWSKERLAADRESARVRSKKQYLRKVGRDRLLTPEEKRQSSLAREAALTPEQRSARTKKGWIKRRKTT